jgi:hypothetical protein
MRFMMLYKPGKVVGEGESEIRLMHDAPAFESAPGAEAKEPKRTQATGKR